MRIRWMSGWVLALSLVACDRGPVFVPPTWVRISAGTFNMGSPTTETCREPGNFKETLHQVTLTHAFEMSISEATQGQFQSELGYNPSQFVECGADCPVEKVSWHQAAAYCNALSRSKQLTPCYTCQGSDTAVTCAVAAEYSTGSQIYTCGGFRLPTEAEWEYACRAGTASAYYDGPAISCNDYDGNASLIGWYAANSGMTLHLAMLKQANAWGLYDMPGSVWEWVHDWFVEDLGAAAVVDPVGATTPTMGRMLRGGSVEVPPQVLRSGSRWNYALPENQLRLHGFRCVHTVP
jgi:formylglycine-generating enzyme required for sulfatase activity